MTSRHSEFLIGSQYAQRAVLARISALLHNFARTHIAIPRTCLLDYAVNASPTVYEQKKNIPALHLYHSRRAPRIGHRTAIMSSALRANGEEHTQEVSHNIQPALLKQRSTAAAIAASPTKNLLVIRRADHNYIRAARRGRAKRAGRLDTGRSEDTNRGVRSAASFIGEATSICRCAALGQTGGRP